MASPVEQFIIVNKFGERVDLDELVQTLKNEEKRVLVNDEVELRRGKKLRAGDQINFDGEEFIID